MGTIMTRGELAMVDFMCHVDWAMGCSDIQQNIILDVSVKEFLDDSNL